MERVLVCFSSTHSQAGSWGGGDVSRVVGDVGEL